MYSITRFTLLVAIIIIGLPRHAPAAPAEQPDNRRPNIILFLVDDMGWQDTSVPFHTERTLWNDLYHTPYMEQLAAQGMRFRCAYSSHPVCSPTRVSLITGLNPARSGVDDWVGHGQSKNRYLKSPQWRSAGLQPGDGIITLPTILHTHGYRTIHVGKAHFGSGKGANPTNLGFDINIGGSHGGGPWGGWYSPWLGEHRDMYPNLHDRPEGEYLTDAITRKAEEQISKASRDGTPFFMNLAHFAVHTPIAAAPDCYLTPYKDARPQEEQHYGSMVTAMDASLGAILKRLEDPDADGDHSDSITNNTIILFLSDNGGLSNHTRATAQTINLDGKPVEYLRDFHNTPAKSGKGSGYEGGFRIPMIIAWAGQKPGQDSANDLLKITPGSACDQPVHGDDIFPTILSIAGIPNSVPAAKQDGQDLRPLLTGGEFARKKPLYWHYPHQWYQDVGVGLGIEPFSAIRDGDWKLIFFYGDGVNDGQGDDPRVELYNLSSDIGEQTNLLKTNPEKALALQTRLFQWLQETKAGIPIISSTNEAVDLSPHLPSLNR